MPVPGSRSLLPMPVLVRETGLVHQWCGAHTSGEADKVALGVGEAGYDQPLLSEQPARVSPPPIGQVRKSRETGAAGKCAPGFTAILPPHAASGVLVAPLSWPWRAMTPLPVVA